MCRERDVVYMMDQLRLLIGDNMPNLADLIVFTGVNSIGISTTRAGQSRCGGEASHCRQIERTWLRSQQCFARQLAPRWSMHCSQPGHIWSGLHPFWTGAHDSTVQHQKDRWSLYASRRCLEGSLTPPVGTDKSTPVDLRLPIMPFAPATCCRLHLRPGQKRDPKDPSQYNWINS